MEDPVSSPDDSNIVPMVVTQNVTNIPSYTIETIDSNSMPLVALI